MLGLNFSFHAELLANNIKKRLRFGVVQIHKREPIPSPGVPLENQLSPSLRGYHNPLAKCVILNSEPRLSSSGMDNRLVTPERTNQASIAPSNIPLSEVVF